MTQELALSVSDQLAYAKTVAGSDIIPQAYRGKPANIVIAMGFGQSMGLSPAESLYRINVIQGKPTMSAELIAAQVRKAGHRLRISKDEKAMSATCTIIRRDDPDAPFTVTRDAAWAERMGLSGKDNYKKQPLTMLTWRAISACAREACPEALYGVAYTPDEMSDMEPTEEMHHEPVQAVPVQAEVVEPTPAPAPEPAPGANLNPVRERFQAFREALGYDAANATSALCTFAGVRSMGELTPEQAASVVGYMDEIIEEARNQQALMPEEVEF